MLTLLGVFRHAASFRPMPAGPPRPLGPNAPLPPPPSRPAASLSRSLRTARQGTVAGEQRGLGAAAHGEVSADDDPYEAYRKRMMLVSQPGHAAGRACCGASLFPPPPRLMLLGVLGSRACLPPRSPDHAGGGVVWCGVWGAAPPRACPWPCGGGRMPRTRVWATCRPGGSLPPSLAPSLTADPRATSSGQTRWATRASSTTDDAALRAMAHATLCLVTALAHTCWGAARGEVGGAPWEPAAASNSQQRGLCGGAFCVGRRMGLGCGLRQQRRSHSLFVRSA